MPSLLHYLALSVLALLPLSSLGLYSGDTDFYETFGGEPHNEAHAPDHKWLSIARQMQKNLISIRDEQFKRDFAELGNMTEFSREREGVTLPLLDFTDGCLPPDFMRQKCLQRIYAGLQEYRVYLSYVDRENLTAAHMVDIKAGTTRLLYLIKETVKVNDKAHSTLLHELPDGSAWKRKTVTHSILYNFAEFMTVTSRAINYMKTKRGIKHMVKDDGLLSKH